MNEYSQCVCHCWRQNLRSKSWVGANLIYPFSMLTWSSMEGCTDGDRDSQSPRFPLVAKQWTKGNDVPSHRLCTLISCIQKPYLFNDSSNCPTRLCRLIEDYNTLKDKLLIQQANITFTWSFLLRSDKHYLKCDARAPIHPYVRKCHLRGCSGAVYLPISSLHSLHYPHRSNTTRVHT